jgi:beta-lactam-binding protein with PASTA domain
MMKYIFLLFIYFYQFTTLAQEPPIDVRNLIGKTKNAVLDSLRDKNIRYEIIELESDEDSGKVIGIEPSIENNLTEARFISVLVAVPKEYEMPNLVNLSVEDALNILTRYKLVLRNISEIESDATPNIVLNQEPQAGVKIKTQTPVDLVISKQRQIPETVAVPNLINRPFDEAREILNQSGLRLGQVQEEESDIERNRVIKQTPEAYTKVEIGSQVNLIITKEIILPQLPRIELIVNDTNPIANQNVRFEVKAIPVLDDIEFLFDYGDKQSSGWTRSSTTIHSFAEEGSYQAIVSARIRGKEIPNSNIVIISVLPVPSPIDITTIIIGVVSLSIVSLLTYYRVIKPRRVRKIFNKTITVQPYKQIGKQKIKLDNNEIPSFSFKLRPVSDKGKQRIEKL